MAHRQLAAFLRTLSSRIGDRSAGVPDAQLLERYVSRHDEAAFELLVWRHERMVQSVCRRLLRREQDVEDAFQATFLVLACKAGAIGKREALASWLYKIAYRLALRERSRTAHRVRFEHQTDTLVLNAVSTCEPAHAADHQDFCRVMDEEVHRLPEKYRAPVVLCYLQGRTNAEAAEELRCPVGTVVTRLARARKRLRTRLTRRGLGLPAGSLVAALSEHGSTTPVRAALRNATLKAAPLFAADPAAPGLVSAQVAALTRGAMTAMMMNKVKLIAGLVLFTCLVGTGTGLLSYRAFAVGTTLTPPDSARLPDARPPQDAAPATPDEANKVDDPPAGRDQAEKSKKKDQAGSKQITAKEVLTKSFKAGKKPRLVVELHNGPVEIKASDEGAIDARITKEARALTEEAAQEALKTIEVKMEQEGDTVRITARRPPEQKQGISTQASAVVRVPPGTAVDVQTANGAVDLTGTTAPAKIRTANGAIRVKDCKNALDLKTSNGAIHAEGGTGRLQLNTSNGGVDIKGTKAVVTAHTNNGGVHFDGSLAEGQHSFETNNGGIILSLPADARFRVDAETSHGRVTSDFTIRTSGSKSKTRLQGAVGEDSSVTIKIRTHNGGIHLQRQGKAE
jgi:RNA polymerase sigma factor (sigma-70 family)